MKKVFTAILILVVLLLAFRVVTRMTAAKKVQAERAIPVEEARPAIGTIEQTVLLTGDIKGQSEVSVKPSTSGRVEEIYVNEGDYVDQGDGLMSYVAGIKADDEMFNDMVTFAPVSGIVGMKTVKIGDQTSAGNTSVFTIYDIDNVKIYCDVPEKYYSFVKSGTPARIELDSYPGKTFTGAISNVRPVVDPMTRTTQVEILIPNPSHIIKPGMFARVTLVLASRSNTVIVPFDTVLGETEKYVFIDKGGIAAKKIVTLGIEQDNNVEILSGLAKDDKVITLGQRVVQEGSKVSEATK